MWKKVLGGTLAVAIGVWMLALIVPQPAPPAWGDVWWWRNQLILLTGVAAWALMSLIMVLAVRPAWLEKPLGGLDKSYRLHKWAGIGAIVLGLLHYGLQLSRSLLADWDAALARFVKVMPNEYRRALTEMVAQKIEIEKQALGGRVFDVLGEAFAELDVTESEMCGRCA